MIKSLIKNFIPASIKERVRKNSVSRQNELRSSLPVLHQNDIETILIELLNVAKGDTVFVHSSTTNLNLDFPAYDIITILLNLIGENGTLVFPTYPKMSSFDFLNSGQVFDVRKTPTYTGLLNEFARRRKDAIRSLHPTKSCVAIGKNARYLIENHEKTRYPYDSISPYFKITEFNGKIIGIGVQTTYLSCVHCVDDLMKEKFPVEPYHRKLFDASCINYSGDKATVQTYAHNIAKMNFDIPGYMKNNITKNVCEDIVVKGQNFFRADAQTLINDMLELANDNITIYKRYHYKLKYFFK